MGYKKTINLFSLVVFLLLLFSILQAVLISQLPNSNGNIIISYKGMGTIRNSADSSVILCADDFSSCQLNITCQYGCLAITCNNVRMFTEFSSNSDSLFRAISNNPYDQLRLNGTESNIHNLGNLSAGQVAKTSFIIRGNIASNNNRIRCTAIMDNSSQISSLPVIANINAFVDISLNVTDIPFPNSDPGTENIASLSNPVNLTNTANSNTAIDVFFNNTNMISSGNVISYANLSVATSNTPTQARAFKGSSYINGSLANQGYIENMPINSSINLFFFLDIQRGQAIGTYNSIIVVRGVQDGSAP